MMMFKSEQNKSGRGYPEKKEYKEQIKKSSKTNSSDVSAAIAQMDSVIQNRMTTHFLDFPKKSTDYMQNECENTGRINIGKIHEDYLMVVTFKNLGSPLSGDDIKADDELYTHFLGLRENCHEHRLLESDFITEKFNLLNSANCNYKKGPIVITNGEPQFDDSTMHTPCLDQELSWSHHCNFVGDLSLTSVFLLASPIHVWSVDKNSLCNGSRSYGTKGFIKSFNPVCNGSVLYSNRALSERISVDKFWIFYNSSMNSNLEHSGIMTYRNLDCALHDLPAKNSERKSSWENPIYSDTMLYVNRHLSFQNPVCNYLMFYPNRVSRVKKPLCNGLVMYLYLDLSLDNTSCNNWMFRDETTIQRNGRALLDRVDFNYFILQGRIFKCVAKEGRLQHSKGPIIRKKKYHTENISHKGLGRCITRNIQSIMCNKSIVSPTMRGSLFEFKGFVYFIAKDQIGCQFLQKVLEKRNNHDVQIIFNETINHMTELIVDPLVNHLIQKLIDVCSEEQITQILLKVTARQGKFVELCFNTHGTRVLQTLIKTLKTRQQKRLVVSTLQTRFLELVKDANGYHIIKSCLQFLSKEDTKFIFDAAAKCHVGCCILKSCIAQSVGTYREKLVTEIASEGFDLAQDAFGNYVIQHIIELSIPSAAAILSSQFRGNYVYLSMQKFGSYVIQTFLKNYEKCRPIVIQEFLLVPNFDHLLQDRFANYVIQTAIDVCKGPVRDLLVEAVQSKSTPLSRPYCKKMFLDNLLTK